MSRQSPIFVSHGAPDLVIAQTGASAFLRDAAVSGERPDAILVVSAHFETATPAIVTDPQPEMIYDFGGFDPVLRTLTYPAPGSADVAARALRLLGDAGLDAVAIARRGFDHGVWVPLMLMFPDADIPVVQMSVQPGRDARFHFECGQALALLASENVLIVGSGSITHNLEVLFRGGLPSRDAPVPGWVSDFTEWMHARFAEGDVEALLDYRRRAPFAVENHPRDEHLLPLFTALGAATGSKRTMTATRLHESAEFGVIAMDAYRFDSAA